MTAALDAALRLAREISAAGDPAACRLVEHLVAPPPATAPSPTEKELQLQLQSQLQLQFNF